MLILILANLALAVIGTVVSALAVHTRARDLIGPVIALPLLIPALIATARAAGPVLAAHGSGRRLADGWRSWLFMILSSPSSPTGCLTFSSRTS